MGSFYETFAAVPSAQISVGVPCTPSWRPASGIAGDGVRRRSRCRAGYCRHQASGAARRLRDWPRTQIAWALLALEGNKEGVDGDVVELGQFELQLLAVGTTGVAEKTAICAGRCRARS